MKKHSFLSYLSLLVFIFLYSCQSSDKSTVVVSPNISEGKAVFVGNKEFDEYWYNGEAELTSYDLEQARYGEIHQGEAVLVFVTEPFSLSKQVKLDDPGTNPKDAVSVLKLNMTKKFYTGIYPYSIMQSSFTPVDLATFPHTLKVTTSSQEWCGHTFTQLNQTKNGYQLQEHSYFESEGESDRKLATALLEDEIWSRIRINPTALPVGNIDLIPGTVFSRLRHTPLGVEKATASLAPSAENGEWMTYALQYQSSNRSLHIHFSKKFPHQIQGWEDSYKSGFGAAATVLTTRASLKKSIQLDYWNKNDVADAGYREKLGLE